MALADLDQLLALRVDDAALAEQLKGPLDLEGLIAIAAERGLVVTEADIFAAQQRDQAATSSAQLQREAAQDARRLRHFIQG